MRRSITGYGWTLASVLALAGIAAARPPQGPAKQHRVRVHALAFDPPVLEVARGDTVRWANEDPVPHTVSDDASAWDSGDLPREAAFAVAFPDTGRFTYSCRYHPTMTATVVVRGGMPAKPSTSGVRSTGSAPEES